MKRLSYSRKETVKLFVFVFIGTLFALLPLSSQAVTVGPVKLEIKADPGDILRGTTFLMNESKRAEVYHPSFEGFIEENGVKKFFQEESDLATWFEMPEAVALNPLEQKNIPYTIHVPKDATPGGHFAVMWWVTGDPKNEQVSIVTRAGILVYLRVSGEIKEEGKVLDFSTSGKKLILGFPVTFNIVFKNDGNVYLKPGGSIEIKSILGRTRTVININKKEFSILPASQKVIEEKWEPRGFVLGPYRANLNLVYGESQQIIEKTCWLFVLPIKSLITLIIILFLIFFGIPKGLKKYNQLVIQKYQSQGRSS